MRKEDYIIWIYEKLDGELSSANLVLLNEWLASDPEHQALHDEITALHAIEDAFADQSDYDAQAALERVKARRTQSSKARVISMRTLMSIAAACFVLGAAIFLLTRSSTPQQYAANDAALHIQLTDGTDVYLQPQSSLTITDFDDTQRKVELDGAAYFDVARDESRRFTINLDEFDVRVLGTAFSIDENPGDGQPHVLVTEGLVEVTAEQQALQLTVNEAARLDNGVIRKVDIPRGNHDSWATTRLIFNNTPLGEAAKTIGRHYKTKVVIENAALEQCVVNAIFVDESIEGVMAHLASTLGITIRENQNEWLISGVECE